MAEAFLKRFFLPVIATSLAAVSTLHAASIDYAFDGGEGAGPAVIAPTGRIVEPAELSLELQKTASNPTFREIEIWQVADGQPAFRTWRARLDSTGPQPVRLDQGQFENGTKALENWGQYLVRARYGTADGTTRWGPEYRFRADDGSSELFNAERITEVHLDIPETSWQRMDDESIVGCAPHNRSYHPGTVRFGNEDFPGSGLRIKGGCGSSRMMFQKAAFKAHLSWDDPEVAGCAEDRRHKGLKRFTFNNQVEDASYTHERIGYDFLTRLGVPVPRSAPVRVKVNGEPWGLYLHVETIDRRFLARHFDSNDGMLYEADYGCDIGEAECFEMKFKTDECDEPRQGDPTDMRPLLSLHQRLALLPTNDFYPAIDRIIDFDVYMNAWAAAVVMGYWDGYPSDPNNYRIYHDPSDDRWTLLPTGIDQLFEKNVDPFDPVGLLSKRCLAELDCAAAFRARLEEVSRLFERSDYPAMVREIARQIAPEVEADIRREMTVAEWRNALEETISYMERRPAEIRKLLEKPLIKVGDNFKFHALTDPRGKRFIAVTWVVPGSYDAPEPQWMTAKGYFDQLSAKLDAFQLAGGSSNGAKIGTVLVDFVDCATASFTYTPNQGFGEPMTRIATIDSEIWKYCP